MLADKKIFQTFRNAAFCSTLPNYSEYLFYFLIPVVLTKVSLVLSAALGKDEFKKGEVISVEHANWGALFFVYGVLFIFTFLSQALYFNPLFLVFRYEFYNIKTKTGASIFLISPYRYKVPQDIVVPMAFRINNYTFIERK